MASLEQIREGVKTIVEGEQIGLKVYPRIPGDKTGRALVIRPTPVGPADFTVAMRKGVDTWRFDLIVLLATSDLDIAQRHLDEYIDGGGTKSIRAAIFANNSLGLDDGTDAHIAGLAAYGPFDFASYDHVGAILRLIVHTTPS